MAAQHIIPSPRKANCAASLTPRQRQILELVLKGHPNKNIAVELGISQRTVESHRFAIMKKTGSKSLPVLVRWAVSTAWGQNDQIETIINNLEQLQIRTTNDAVIRLYSCWLTKCGDRSYPSRDDLDLGEFKFAINNLSFVDVLENPRRFRYRIVSPILNNRLGYEMVDKCVDDIPEEDVRNYVQELYTRALDLRMPLHEKSMRIFDNLIWQHEMLLLPLSADGEVIDMLMIYRIYSNPISLSGGGDV